MKAVAAERASFDPLGAGALLIGTLLVCIAVGGLLGWAAGSVEVGVAIGAMIGMPAGVANVIRRYRGAF
jgi:F0F1-type ATP synthase assembly protein I